jgi:hypothetical protein
MEVLMRFKMVWFAVLCVVLSAVPALAGNDGNCQLPAGCGGGWTYDNGPINGTTDAWTINFGYIVSDTFVAAGTLVNGFTIGVWEFPGDTMSSLDWSITSGENSGTVFGSGTAQGSSLRDTFISNNQYGYNIDKIEVTGLNVASSYGTTYWLNLQNASVPSGDPVYWDENSGAGCTGVGCPSQASENALGTLASEAFAVCYNANGAACALATGGGGTPEPSSILLFGSGVFGLAGLLRHKLFR